ncbi:MAG TPA: hypothetical protein VFI73_10850 [Candidatus Nitrosopolaris sp.]|nr:hypothetical protein [Candidatus Nitrosopolaris sp.]
MSDSLIARTVIAPSTRTFIIKFLSFQNGCFIVVAEGANRIGSLYVSMASSNKVNTAKVIPSKYDSMFINTISERVSSMINGICLVCIHSIKQLHLDDMKAIMGEIMNLVGEEDDDIHKKQNGNIAEK